jgi:hypothetical protein
MEYIVPQFIEREPKIIGPFTFKQFIFIGIAGGILIFLYFVIKSLALFILIAIILLGAALAMAFFKFGGFPLPKLIKNFFVFSSRPKVYLWGKKTIPPKVFKKEVKPKKEEKEEEESVLKIAEKSHLKNLSTFLETKTK